MKSILTKILKKVRVTNAAAAWIQYVSSLDFPSQVTGRINRRYRSQYHRYVYNQKSVNVFHHESNAVFSIWRRSGFPLIKIFPKIQYAPRKIHLSSPKESQNPGNKKSDKEEEDNKISSLLAKAILWMLTAYMVIAIMSLMFPRSNQPEVVRYVSWHEFVHHMLAKGEVEEIIVRPDVDIVTIILHDGAIIKGKRMDQKVFHMVVYDTNRFEDKLREAEKKLGIRSDQVIPVMYERSSDTAGRLLASLIVVGLLLSLLSRHRNLRPPLGMDPFSHIGRAKFTLVDPLAGHGRGVHFSDVAGLNEAKQEVMEFVDYLKRPEHYKSLGAKVPKGALLLGPPGCGKTLLAKAVATEANVPFLSMNGSEFIEMIGGLGAARVRDLFREARKRSPCIIYIDEVDAVGRKRISGGAMDYDGASGEVEQTLNQLLVEMDGMASKEGVVVLASTNRAEVLDKALLRPGRFDRHILIDLPTLDERKQIIEQHLKSVVMENEPEFYSKRLAHLTPGFSGADIANICNEAALHAARLKQPVVKGNNLEYAVERLVGGTLKRSNIMSLEEKRMMAYHESGHAVVGWMLARTDSLLKVTIVPRTNLSLGFAQYVPSEKYLFSKEELFEKMCVTLGGRAAETLTFNQITDGAKSDLKAVTKMAYSQVRHFGMSDKVGLLSFPEGESTGIGKRPYSKKLTALMDSEVHKLVAIAYKTSEEIIKNNSDKLKVLAEALLEQETLNYNDVERLIGPPPHKKKRLVGIGGFEEPSMKEKEKHVEEIKDPVIKQKHG